MDNLQQEFITFIELLEKRTSELGLELEEYPIDHICYRAANDKDYQEYLKLFSKNSILFSLKDFHDRQFRMFLLKKPLVYKEIEIFCMEFAQPGGSDNYETGFQHIEYLTNKNLSDLIKNEGLAEKYMFAGKYGDEKYLKWEDKTSVKTTKKPLFLKGLTENSPEITIN